MMIEVHMKKSRIVLLVIAIITFLSVVGIATFAFFAGTQSINNVANLNVVTEDSNMVFDTMGGAMSLNVTMASMQEAKSGNIAVANNTTLTVNFTSNTSYSMVCSYDIVFEWTSSDKYQAHSTGASGKEFTIQANPLFITSNVSEGTNNISSETDLSVAVGNQTSATVVSGAKISNTGSTPTTAIWTLQSKFYNLNVDQVDIANKNYEGHFKVSNVACTGGSVPAMAYWYGSTTYSAGSTPGTTYNTLALANAASGQDFAIGSTASKHYVCALYGNKDICLAQDFTQYGVYTHIVNTNFTSNEQSSAQAVISRAYAAAGITGYTCASYNTSINCAVNNLRCGVHYTGKIFCKLNDSIGVTTAGSTLNDI